MPNDTISDILDLAVHARQRNAELRPLLLRVHTQRFVAAAGRGDVRSREFEDLALGLIPLVADDVVAEVSMLLRGIPETPVAVTRLLGDRAVREGAAAPAASDEATAPDATGHLHRPAVMALLDRNDPSLDLALALNRQALLEGAALATLVRRALDHRPLARALLERSEPTLLHRACLYRHAERASRDGLRAELRTTPLAAAMPTVSADGATRSAVADAAAAHDLPALFRHVADALGLPPATSWDLDDAAEREMFVLALVAAGWTHVEVVHVVLELDGRAERRDGALFRLAGIARTTPRGVAQVLAAPQLPVHARPGQDDGERRAPRLRPSTAPARRPASVVATGSALTAG